jgi:YgiT-type zinc finger domain-containing protein
MNVKSRYLPLSPSLALFFANVYNKTFMAEKKDKKPASQGDEEAQACEECGGTLKPNKIRLEEFEGGKLFVIEDAPVMECESCGEVWVPQPIIDEFEQMMDAAKKNKHGKNPQPKTEASKAKKPKKK